MSDSRRPLTLLILVLMMLAVMVFVTGCAFYKITAVNSDGSKVEGVAVVANNSKEIKLSVKSKDVSVTFGKSDTDGASQLDVLNQLVK